MMSVATEPHYTPAELAATWRLHPATVRRTFRDMPGVLKVSSGQRTSLRIPASVAARWHEAHSGRWDEIQRSRSRV